AQALDLGLGAMLKATKNLRRKEVGASPTTTFMRKNVGAVSKRDLEQFERGGRFDLRPIREQRVNSGSAQPCVKPAEVEQQNREASVTFIRVQIGTKMAR